MSQQSLIWPLGIIMVVMIIIIAALTNPTAPSAAPAYQDGCQATYPAYPDCVTETAEAERTRIAETSAARQVTASPNATATQNITSTSNTTPTSTRTATRTAATTAAEDATSAPTNTPRATRQQETVTPTSTLIPDSEVLTCLPGVPVMVSGEGPANAALLLYFDGRAVGGTTSDSRGAYRIQLVVGEERPGDYPLEVRVRGTTEQVDEFTCRVPAAEEPGEDTPTPTEMN